MHATKLINTCLGHVKLALHYTDLLTEPTNQSKLDRIDRHVTCPEIMLKICKERVEAEPKPQFRGAFLTFIEPPVAVKV